MHSYEMVRITHTNEATLQPSPSALGSRRAAGPLHTLAPRPLNQVVRQPTAPPRLSAHESSDAAGRVQSASSSLDHKRSGTTVLEASCGEVGLALSLS